MLENDLNTAKQWIDIENMGGPWLTIRDVSQLKFDTMLSLLHKQIHTVKQLQATNYIILLDLLFGFLPARKWLG